MIEKDLWGFNVIGKQGVDAKNDFAVNPTEDGEDISVRFNNVELTGEEFESLKEIAHGGGSEGTYVVANPEGAFDDVLHSILIGDKSYGIEAGGSSEDILVIDGTIALGDDSLVPTISNENIDKIIELVYDNKTNFVVSLTGPIDLGDATLDAVVFNLVGANHQKDGTGTMVVLECDGEGLLPAKIKLIIVSDGSSTYSAECVVTYPTTAGLGLVDGYYGEIAIDTDGAQNGQVLTFIGDGSTPAVGWTTVGGSGDSLFDDLGEFEVEEYMDGSTTAQRWKNDEPSAQAIVEAVAAGKIPVIKTKIVKTSGGSVPDTYTFSSVLMCNFKLDMNGAETGYETLSMYHFDALKPGNASNFAELSYGMSGSVLVTDWNLHLMSSLG